MFVDTHAHLNDDKLYGNIEEIIKSAKDNMVEPLICASPDFESSIRATEIAKKYNNVYSTLGFHPYFAVDYNDEVENKFIELAKDPNNKVVAIGEIGLDYHMDTSPVEVQKEVFIKQIKLADKLELPIIIHMRDATGDTMQILRENKDLIRHGGILHCFNGSVETMNEIFELGLLVSFGGAITFKNAKNFEALLKHAPLGKFVLETDCPYLTPVPYRGNINEPKYIPIIADKIASTTGYSIEEIAKETTKAAKLVFNIKE